jgi:hypothetical protein
VGKFQPNPYLGERVQTKVRTKAEVHQLFLDQAHHYGFRSAGEYLTFLVQHVAAGDLDMQLLADRPRVDPLLDLTA